MLAVLLVLPLSTKAAENGFIPTVNIVTTAGDVVALPSEVQQADSRYQLATTKVQWESINPEIFNDVGEHVVLGKTEDGQKTVKGVIHVFSKAKPVNVAAIGDSITYGMNVENVLYNAYPKQLNNRLAQITMSRITEAFTALLLRTATTAWILMQKTSHLTVHFLFVITY
ncbi:hypothetical protein [Listeria booriae]|nr:hypothetical protein [Listeria booriae]MBC1513597.1 hypothetical protein [Listeria booriae]MBC6306873.1 hypothetical protein [Listeria booriae]